MERVQVLSTKCIPGSKEMSRPTEGEVLGEVTRLSWPGIKSGLHCITAPLPLCANQAPDKCCVFFNPEAT